MRGLGAVLVLAALGGAASGGEREEATPNAFLARGEPTFVVGTAGDDDADRKVRIQAELVREMLFPRARLVEKTEIDLRRGRAGWPENPVLYGGPHVNRVLARLAPELPFRLEPGRLAIGDRTFTDDPLRRSFAPSVPRLRRRGGPGPGLARGAVGGGGRHPEGLPEYSAQQVSVSQSRTRSTG